MAKRTRVKTESGQWVDLASAVTDLSQYANLNNTPISGFRNAIINGKFDIWQRGTSFSSAGYTADRFAIVAASGQTVAVSQQAFTPGNAISGYESAYFLRAAWSGTPSGTYWLTQRVEDVRTFAGQTATLSFWAKASTATTAFTPMIEQNFGSGGSGNNSLSATSPISLTTSWQRFSVTFAVPSISGKTIGTNSYLDVRPLNGGSSVAGINVDIWGVQLETGSIATPFEQRPIGTELALCQRYYWRNTPGISFGAIGMGFADNTTIVDILINNPVPMRTIPTVFEPSNVRVMDYQNVPTLSNIVLDGSRSSLYITKLSLTVSGAIAFRPYVLEASTAAGYIGLGAEL